MKTYRISKKALADLEEIWKYTFENWSVERADRYYTLLIEEIKYLCKDSDSGKSMNHVKKGYRTSKVKSHLIFYRISEGNSLEVIRILHERMDIPNQLKD